MKLSVVFETLGWMAGLLCELKESATSKTDDRSVMTKD
jgi:hypothetical protein